MRRLAAMAVLMVLPAKAVIVDRVAIAVGNKVITQSEVDQRIRLTAFENRETPEFSPAARRQAAQRMLDQKLVEREMDVGRYPRTDYNRGKDLFADFEKENYGTDPAAVAPALAAAGVTREDVAADLVRQADLLTFLELRFRPAVQVSEEDVRQYAGAGAPSGEITAAIRTEIERRLTEERADKQLDAWLAEQRRTTRIEYADKELQPAGVK